MNTLSLETLGTELQILPTLKQIAGNAGGTEAALPPLPDLRLRTILVPFDFSDVSSALLHRLVGFAEGAGAALHILYVVEPPGMTETGESRGLSAISKARIAAAEFQLRVCADQVSRSQISITSAVRMGRATEEIVSHARAVRADLIVMSAHVGTGLKNVLLRTTTERVVRLAPCPVLVIGRDKVSEFLPEAVSFPPRSWKRILLPVDLANSIPGALALAAAIARVNNAKLHILHAVSGNSTEAGEGASTAKSLLAEWLRAELCWPVDFEATVWTGLPLAHAILTEACRAQVDVIVLPARDCLWSRRLRLWSVTDGILRHAPCPVLCVNENANR